MTAPVRSGAKGVADLSLVVAVYNDVRALEVVLEQLDFEVFVETNRDLKRTRRALEDFREDAKGADVALLFFAGWYSSLVALGRTPGGALGSFFLLFWVLASLLIPRIWPF